MLQMVIVIRGEVDDEAEAHQILHFIDNLIEAHPERELTADCSCSQVITND